MRPENARAARKSPGQGSGRDPAGARGLAPSGTEAYTRVVTAASRSATTAVAPAPSQRLRRRRLPSPAEQARRVAWGQRFGPLTGAAIRNAIKEHGTR